MNKICPNPNIKNPVFVKVIAGQYQGHRGWIDDKPNEHGIVRFCDESGENPYQFNSFPYNFERM